VPAPRDIDFVALRALQVKHGASYPANHVVFREGEAGDDFYVILDGEIEMLVARPDGGMESVAVLRRGDFFGEMAVFRGEPRTATARTRTPTSLLFFGERTAAELLVTSPRFSLGIIRTLCDRVGALTREVVVLRNAVDSSRATTGLQEASGAAAAAADPPPPTTDDPTTER
jgi:CRP/FNR family cyclic AMP-dependent transcriptional regulator